MAPRSYFPIAIALSQFLNGVSHVQGFPFLCSYIVRPPPPKSKKGSTSTLWNPNFVDGFAPGKDCSSDHISSSSKKAWDDRFEDLQLYKAEHGDCLVPQNFQSLGKWVSNQRLHYGLLQKAEPSSMTQERIDKLERVGFVWSLRDQSEKQWESRWRELKLYKEEYGDCLIPKKFPANPPLGRWVITQRQQYRLFKEGKPSNMNQMRIEKLEQIGFVWHLHDKNWDDSFEELRVYHAKNGDCVVPQQFEENPYLGSWVNYQRQQHRLRMEGKPSSITKSRINQLESLGFVWSIREKPDERWRARFEELKCYKSEHGDCLVPRSFPSLGNWVNSQRKAYGLFKRGEHSTMTKERAEKLEELGFVWSVHVRARKS